MVGKRLMSAGKLLCFVLLELLIGCGFGCASDTKEISFACWNVQTFFDANNDGVEYAEFRKGKNWNKETYLVRLQRLAEVIKALDCDVFALEEIENEKVVRDILNQLAGTSWKNSKNWNYTCFAKEPGASIGCAVFSRFPLGDMRVHSMDVRVEEETQPSCRPIVQVSVYVGETQLVLLVNHWKSKSGSGDSDVWRNWQESLLTDRICKVLSEKEGVSVVACGDFNRDIEEFEICSVNENDYSGAGNGIVRLRNFHPDVFENGSYVLLFSPWLASDGAVKKDGGSYFYKGQWERIDHIFTCGNAVAREFETCARIPWAEDDGVPVSYKIYNGTGYSDHLPLKCTISLF